MHPGTRSKREKASLPEPAQQAGPGFVPELEAILEQRAQRADESVPAQTAGRAL